MPNIYLVLTIFGGMQVPIAIALGHLVEPSRAGDIVRTGCLVFGTVLTAVGIWGLTGNFG